MSNYTEALELLLQFNVLLAIAGGTLLGLVMGSLPGLSAAMAIALLLPLSFSMPPVMGMGMLLGAFCGAIAGGSVSATLLNIPGTPSSVCTTLDAFPMARRGEGSKALGIATASSFIGGIASALLLMFLAPPIANLALSFGPAEFFSLSLFGLMIIASVSGQSMLKGLMAGLIGLLVSTVGADPMTGILRFTFDEPSLLTGVSLLPALIGLFAIAQVLQDIETHLTQGSQDIPPQEVRASRLPFGLVIRCWKILLSSSFIGSLVGAIPGAGGSIASFMSYDQAKRMSKTPEKFGTGHHEGIVASECSNNAMAGGALIPMLTLGVPGEVATAVLMGGLMIQGIQPGPNLFEEQGPIIYGIFLAFIVANLFMLLLQWLGIRLFVRVLSVPVRLLTPLILVFCVIGVYGVNNNLFDLYLMLGFGVLGYFLNKYGYGTAPVILGMILGGIAESNLRRGLLVFDGNWAEFFLRPISLTFLLLAAGFLALTCWQNRKASTARSA